jgi:polyisoprenoid-binding protein YceI
MKLFSFAAGLAAVSIATSTLALTPADAPSGTYKLDTTHASLNWKVRHMGLANYVSRFTKFDAEIKYDAANPAKSSVRVTIDPKSVRTDYPFPEKVDFDAKLAGENFFNAAKYPEIKFVSTGMKKTGPTTGRMTGDLTLLGVTKPVTLTVTLTGALKEHMFTKKPALGFSATGTVKRSDFGMKYGIPGIADDVQLDINAEFMKAD